MQPGTHVQESLGFVHERGQDVRCQAVHGEDLSYAVGGLLAIGGETKAGVVDDGIEWARFVGVGGELLQVRDGRQITNDDTLCFGNSCFSLSCAVGITGMKKDAVALFGEDLCCLLAQTCSEETL